ncbi:STAS/SEC14 domain-containing protein [Pontibacter anaerobius]|uniref:STAS/SEC14 domain-containing protein n=1 Tax=Pontibacter anaerobius TaxID=2993940 RepID=A0ABT3RIA4_9BACT|nr:STAS/SEC14 domain-containing protein [Pontibacter anaerobius]MCX2741103.1 STAS/SEC14 domain-containing protein [Pontibacter anaerobius]
MPASKVILLSEPKLMIYTEPEHQLMVVQANGEVPSATYRSGLQLATDEAIEKGLQYWLVNNKAGGIITPADQNWANEVIAPLLAHKSRIRKMALIEPEDVVSHLILESMMDSARSIFPFEMQFFGKVEDAYEWFRDSEV